jgi:transposase
MRFVPTKSEEQQSGLMLHRSRQLLVRQRTMLSNAIRGHMAELGIISAKGRDGTAELLKVIARTGDGRIPLTARFCLEVLARQYVTVTAEVAAIDKRIHAWHRSCRESRRLEEIPGIGLRGLIGGVVMVAQDATQAGQVEPHDLYTDACRSVLCRRGRLALT